MPNRFIPVGQDTDITNLIRAINGNFAQLDAEAALKQFKDKNGNGMLMGNIGDGIFGMRLLDDEGTGLFIGLYRDNRFGILQYYKGTPVALYGMAPDDGRQGAWIVPVGENVITLLGG